MSRKRSLMSRYHGISKQNPNHAAELHVFRLTMSAYKHRGKKKKCRIRTHISSDIAFVSGALEISISHPLSHLLAATAVFSLKTSQLYFVWV